MNMDSERRGKLCRPAVFEFVQNGVKSSRKITFGLSSCLLFLSVVVTLIFLESAWKTVLAASGILQVCFIVVVLSCTASKERILVMRSVGLQIKTSYILGREKTSFFSQQRIVDIIINEAISMHKVSYYIALLLKADGKYHAGDLEVIPLFTNTMPPIKVLKEIKRGCQEVLLDDVS